MSMFYRIIIVLLIMAAGYTLYGIGHFKWIYHRIDNPHAEFLITGNAKSDITVVEFLNYNCGYCKDLHPVIEELISIRPDIRYVARPISFSLFEQAEGEEEAIEVKDNVTKILIAAGFQGKFWEMHKAVLEHPEGRVPDSFIEETAMLYGLDYDLLIKDSESKKVEKITDENLSVFNHVGLFSVPSFVIDGKIYSVSDDNLPDLKQLLAIIAQAKE